MSLAETLTDYLDLAGGLTYAPDCVIFCPVVNRFDLLETAMQSVYPHPMIVIDNSDGALERHYVDYSPSTSYYHVVVYQPPVPLVFTQTSNLEYRIAQQLGCRYYIHLHSDAQFPAARIDDILAKARAADAAGKRWLVGFTLYDILCIYNTAAMADLGGYDSHLFDFYFSDNSLWRKALLAGYERLEFGGEGIIHNGGGSVTINSDSRWQVCNDHTFPLTAMLYRAMWGGDPGSETFTAPFNRPDVFTDLKTPIP